MNKIARALCCLPALLPLSPLVASQECFAIFRIGNAYMGSRDLGFTATVIQPFQFVKETEDDGAVLGATPLTPATGTTIVIKPLDKISQRFKNVSREEFRTSFSSPGYVLLSGPIPAGLGSPQNSCVEAAVGRDGSHIIGVASWGNGKGVVFGGPTNSLVYQAITEMLTSILLDEEACEWK
jgi:hypothetical protein